MSRLVHRTISLWLIPTILFLFGLLFLVFSGSVSAQTPSQNPHPLRPNPFELVAEEEAKTIDDPTLTLYCAQRPTIVQPPPVNAVVGRPPTFNVVDRRSQKLTAAGILVSNFQSFVTPLLSITDDSKYDFTLPNDEKIRRYLLDYFEGRAYYEEFAEDPADPAFQEDFQRQQYPIVPGNPILNTIYNAFIPSRLGVFRELAPKTYQDRLRRALIKRATGQFDLNDNPYGFEPATQEVHDYLVGYWNPVNNEVAPYGAGQEIYLNDYDKNWAPLPEEFDTAQAYASASAEWQQKDNGKWFKLWEYVPMFTREDTKGFIEVIDEPGQISNADTKDVIFPHLSRAYEVGSSLAFLLSPQETHDYDQDPQLADQWFTPAPWYLKSEEPWWIISDENQSQWDGLGPVCDPGNTQIPSSGDFAQEDVVTTLVYKTIDNPEYVGPASQPSACGDLYSCERCVNPIAGIAGIDYTGCLIKQDLRYDPTYFKTYTPFLDTLMTRLVTCPGALFGIFKPLLEDNPPPENWLGVGNPTETNIEYDFTPGRAEAGYREPPKPAKFYYKYLGYIHCQKERILAKLQPFVTGQAYQPFSDQCGFGTAGDLAQTPGASSPPGGGSPPPGGGSPTPPTCSGGPNPSGTWLDWPYAFDVDNAYLTSCYKEERGAYCHGGLDMDPGGPNAKDNVPFTLPVYAAGSGQIYYTNGSPNGCGDFGACVIIDHCNGSFTLYGHMDSFSDGQFVSVGQQVDTATQVGIQDNTGQSSESHLHLGLSQGGAYYNFYYSGLTADPCAAIPGCSCNTGEPLCN